MSRTAAHLRTPDPPLGDPEFLDLDEVVSLHDQQLARYGGAAGLRKADSLASPVARPQASFGGEFLHADLFHMAAADAFHITENQPFVDGNKRTASLPRWYFST
jgi:death-on-curing protein